MASGFDLRLPQPLDCSNLAKEWPRWRQAFAIYLRASGKTNESEADKIAIFLWLIGVRGVEIFNSLFPNDGSMEDMFGQGGVRAAGAVDGDGEVFEDAAEDAQERPITRTLAEVIAAFNGYCIPRRNIAMEAYKFNTIVQKERQTFAEFETELRTQIQYCEFKCSGCQAPYGERMLRDRIIIGVQDKKLQLKLLDGSDEPLMRVIETCKVFEAASANKQLLDKGVDPAKVNAITKSPEEESTKKDVDTVRQQCYRCGQDFNRKHLQRCPARNEDCFICGEKGHFKDYCKKKKQKDDHQVTRQPPRKEGKQEKAVHSLNWSDAGKYFIVDQVDNAYSNQFTTNTYRISSLNESKRPWKKVFQIEGVPIRFKLDTGSDVNCIPVDIVKKLNIPVDEFGEAHVVDYSSNKIKIHGKVELLCVNPSDGSRQSAQFLVVDNNLESLLGLESCVDFGLIKRLNAVERCELPKEKKGFIDKYSDIFEGLGKIPGKCSITLKEGSNPSLHYKKRIPFALTNPLKKELNRLEKLGIISFVDYPTDWISNMQIVEKPNGDLRICLDPKPLNNCIKREHFLIPTHEDLFSRLSGKTIFTVLDLSCGFWQLELDRASSDLTTFMTPFGRYRWNRVPFGLNNAPEMFQRRMVQIFGDIPGVEVYFDDLAIAGENEAEHDRALLCVLDRARQYNVKFNSEKLQYRQDQVKFMGSIIGNGKMSPLEKDVRAVTQMPKPHCVADVARLLGLLKYLAKYIPNLSKRTANLRQLTHKDSKWEWTETHDQEMQDLLSFISSKPVLAVYEPDKPCIIQTDSSKDGLGCVLLQEHGPVAYASRTLTQCEQRWAQIEKELLAVVFACKRFHHFLYGREFTVQSDHKPLETLVKRDIDEVTPRLQRMFMTLLKYPGLTIVYTPGKDMLVADCLSRAPLPETGDIDTELEEVVHSLTKNACMSKHNYERYREALGSDERYQRIVEYVQNGWPTYHQLDSTSQLFHKYRDELHFENGLLFKNHRLVIPTNLQGLICKWLHAPHLGIEKTLAKARNQFFWPGMTNDLTELVKSCTTCEKFRRNNQKEPLTQEPQPEYPFQRVSTDIYEYAGQDWLVLIDAYSGLICSDRLGDKTMTSVCKLFDKFFNSYGYPTQIRSDNVPFNCLEFERYADKNNIKIEFSSPRYPQSNGLAEKGVAIAKNLLKRCYEEGEVEQFQYRILEYNTTPVASMQLSPSQLFFGRQLKTRLPVNEDLLLRESPSEGLVRQRFARKLDTQKCYYDRTAKALPPLSIGDHVMFKKNSKEWHYGQIIRDVNGSSYIVKDHFGNHFRRNRRFISRTTNSELNTSELLVETCNPNQSKAQELAGQGQGLENDQNSSTFANRTCSPNVRSTASESGLGRLSQEPPVANENGSLNQQTSPVDSPSSESSSPRIPPIATRSGRIVVPPNRYGQWTV